MVGNFAAKAASALNSLHNSHRSSHLNQTRHISLLPSVAIRAAAHVEASSTRYVSRLAPVFRVLSDDKNRRETTSLYSATYSLPSEALHLQADRVSLPADDRQVPILDLLPAELAARYSSPNPEILRPPDEVKSAPCAFLVSSDRDWLSIVLALHSRRMVVFKLECELKGPVCGAFGTDKGDGRQRFVGDCRPANELWCDPPHLELTGPDHLSQLQAQKGVPIAKAKDDLDNCFHRLRTPDWFHAFFPLPPVRAADVGLGHVHGVDTPVYPCCTTLVMGFSHAAFICQESHLNVIRTRTTFDPADRICLANDLRLDRVRYGTYLDDQYFVGPAGPRMAEMQLEYNNAIEAAGLVAKVSKRQLPTTDPVDIIGHEFGRDATMGVAPPKLYSLCLATDDLLRSGSCTGLQLSRIVGRFTWAFLARRAALSVFSSVYRFIVLADRRTFEIWPSVRRELRAAIDLAPLLYADLAAPFFDRTVAFDASTTGMGVVAAPLAREKLAECALMRPPNVPATEDRPVPASVDRSCPGPLVGAQWATIVSVPFAYEEHINCLEARALDASLRWVASHPRALGSRVLLWSDSLVVTFAARKGRSSSFPLLRRLRASAALLMATGMAPVVNWVPTEHNPADGPSRAYQRWPDRAVAPSDHTWKYLEKSRSSNDLGDGPSRTPCRDSAYLPPTNAKYQRCLRAFADHAHAQGFVLGSPQAVDEALADFTESVYLENGGRCRHLAVGALAAIRAWAPVGDYKFRHTRLALRGWSRLCPPRSRPPLTWDLTCLIAVVLAANGRPEEGTAVLLAFEALLRIGELTSLRWSDVADSGDRRLGFHLPTMALRLRDTKTGVEQSVTVESPEVMDLLRQHRIASPHSESDFVFDFGPAHLRACFKWAVGRLGLTPDYVFHSLRHGGATRMMLMGRPLEEVLQRGRWVSCKSARHYVQMGRALLLSLQLPPLAVRYGPIIAARLLYAYAVAQSGCG